MVRFFFFDSKLFALVPKTCHLLLLDLKFFVRKLSRIFNTLEKAFFFQEENEYFSCELFSSEGIGRI